MNYRVPTPHDFVGEITEAQPSIRQQFSHCVIGKFSSSLSGAE
jgi:hypothetical protein